MKNRKHRTLKSKPKNIKSAKKITSISIIYNYIIPRNSLKTACKWCTEKERKTSNGKTSEKVKAKLNTKHNYYHYYYYYYYNYYYYYYAGPDLFIVTTVSNE